MTRAARAEIDLQALRHNLHRVHQTTPQSRVMAMIKANGYGRGLLCPFMSALATAMGVRGVRCQARSHHRL